jgi:hypothetical protein
MEVPVSPYIPSNAEIIESFRFDEIVSAVIEEREKAHRESFTNARKNISKEFSN